MKNKFNRIVVPAVLYSMTLACAHSSKQIPVQRQIAAEKWNAYLSGAGNDIYVYKQSREVKDPQLTDISTVIRGKGEPKLINDFLLEVKKQFPDFFRAYTLAYDSLSIQSASFENPRVLVFGASARLILTFNGHNSQNGFSTVEMMTYSDQKGFEFRELLFLKEMKATETEDDFHDRQDVDEALSSKWIRVSKPNTQRCLQCHGIVGEARPNWDNYFLWPGFYGSEDDNLFRPDTPSLNRIFTPKAGDDVERNKYISFISSMRTNKQSRYSILEPLARIGSACYPVFNGKAECSGDLLYPRPNLFLTALLDDLSFRRATYKEIGNPGLASEVLYRLACLSPDWFKEQTPEYQQKIRKMNDEITAEIRQHERSKVLRMVSLLGAGSDPQKIFEQESLTSSYYKKVLAELQKQFPKESAVVLQATALHAPGSSFRTAVLQEFLEQKGINIREWTLNLRREALLVNDGGAFEDFSALLRPLDEKYNLTYPNGPYEPGICGKNQINTSRFYPQD